jgi:hypothetical protein
MCRWSGRLPGYNRLVEKKDGLGVWGRSNAALVPGFAIARGEVPAGVESEKGYDGFGICIGHSGRGLLELGSR